MLLLWMLPSGGVQAPSDRDMAGGAGRGSSRAQAVGGYPARVGGRARPRKRRLRRSAARAGRGRQLVGVCRALSRCCCALAEIKIALLKNWSRPASASYP
jgi:hypothetical protein